MVLEDGRIIEEDVPEVTVDTIEDTQSHDEDGDEDRRHFYNDNWATTPRDTWSATGDVLSEKNQRNIYTKNIQEKSVTTASAKNMGDISSKDVDKIIRHGKRTRQFIRAHDDDSSSTDPVSIPAKVIHTGKSNRVLVDREDIREINRMHDGKVQTERHVTREMIEDAGNETPEEGDSTEETESRDGDRVQEIYNFFWVILGFETILELTLSNTSLTKVFVVYFYQKTGAPHPVCWSKLFVSGLKLHFPSFFRL